MEALYVFTDSRFADRVKIGRCRDATAGDCLRAACSYSPATVRCVAVWLFDQAAPVETQVLRALATHSAGLANGGKEVFLLSAEEAIGQISHVVGKVPDGVPAVLPGRPDYDDLRHPPTRNLLSVANRRWRQVAWIYAEQAPGDRIKTSRISDWKTPLEPRKRYSFCGLKAVAAFSYVGPVSDDGNLVVDAAVQDVVGRFGPGPGHGWLAQGTTVDEVAAAYAARLTAIAIDPQRPPEGVRAAYNRAA